MKGVPSCYVAYDISADAYWLYHGGRRLLLRGLTCEINGLLDKRPLDDLPSYERDGVEICAPPA